MTAVADSPVQKHAEEFDVCRTVHHCDNWRIKTN